MENQLPTTQLNTDEKNEEKVYEDVKTVKKFRPEKSVYRMNLEKNKTAVFTLVMPLAQRERLAKFARERKHRYNSMAQVARIAISDYLDKIETY